jgi:hypothetical protein
VQEVEDALEGAELRYSERRRLLKRAEHFGVRPFDANLLIAMVQHRSPQEPVAVTRSTTRRQHLVLGATFIVLQTTILLAAWYVLR